MNATLSRSERYRGCLLGGAVGDALGAPVEFLGVNEIKRKFGADGICDFAPAYGRVGAITDDTQMTLFTAEGLLRAHTRGAERGICHPPSVVHHAYMRWLKTQGEAPVPEVEVGMDGWLIGLKQLWSRRAPGSTCLAALRDARRLGEAAKNNSKGCGGVMRAAPVGLAAQGENAFDLGSGTAALTHGHPSGSLSAGFLALLIEKIVSGLPLKASTETAKQYLAMQPGHGEVMAAVQTAEKLAKEGKSVDALCTLGAGWVAEEALAIALYCSLAADNLEEAVVMAVNHSGDSDSTGAIAGNICGALYGSAGIPSRWLASLELREEIGAVADDLAALWGGELEEITERLWVRYPGW